MKRNSPGASRAAIAAVAAAPRAEGKRKVRKPPWMTITIDDTDDSDEDGAVAAVAHASSKRARAQGDSHRRASGSTAGGTAAGANGANKQYSGVVAQEGSLHAQLAASQRRVLELQGQADFASQRLMTVRAHLAERDQEVMILQKQLNELEDAVLCPICMERRRTVAFSCGHTSCDSCSAAVRDCHTCRKKIIKRLALF